MRIGLKDVAFGFGPRSFGWAIVLAGVAWLLTATTATAHAAPQDGVDPTGSNFRIWGRISFNRQIGPDDVIVQIAAGGSHTVAVLADGSVACWGRNTYGQCDVPSGIGTPENPVASVAAGVNFTVAVLAVPTVEPCPADLDGDSAVGGSDLGRLFIDWGPCGDCAADFDGDGNVDGGDLGQLFTAWGDCPD